MGWNLNKWLIIWWFALVVWGSRALSNNPFHKGIANIPTTNPNHQLTIGWKPTSFESWSLFTVWISLLTRAGLRFFQGPKSSTKPRVVEIVLRFQRLESSSTEKVGQVRKKKAKQKKKQKEKQIKEQKKAATKISFFSCVAVWFKPWRGRYEIKFFFTPVEN